jgi:hypothetical protein
MSNPSHFGSGKRPYHQVLDTPELIRTITEDLEHGFSTPEIATDCGVQYDSLVRRLNRIGEQELRVRLSARREEEFASSRGHAPRRPSRRAA